MQVMYNKGMKRGWPTSAYLLLSANIVPLMGVMFWSWNIVDLLFIYWAESAVIGFYSLLKLILIKHESADPFERIMNVIAKIFGSVFFIVHFGGFMLGHGLFLYVIANEYLGAQVDLLQLCWATRYALLAMLISHGYSFVTNFLIKGEKNREKGSDPMLEPYARIIVMHLTLIFGMFLVLIFQKVSLLLVLFIILKTALDLRGHLRERNKFSAC